MTPWRGWTALLFAHVAWGLLRLEDSDPRVIYSPTALCSHVTVPSCVGFWWTENDTLSGAANNTFHSTTGGAAVSLSLIFEGSTLSLYGRRSQRAGAAYVTIDSASKSIVLFSTLEEHGESELLFHADMLDPDASHTLKLEYASDIGDGRAEIDYFEVEEMSPVANAARDPEPTGAAAAALSNVFPPYMTAISLAMGIIALVLALLLMFYCCYTRQRKSRMPATGQGRPSMSIDVPLRHMQLYEQPTARRFFTPPDAPSHRPSSPGVPVDERDGGFPTLSQIARDIPETPRPVRYFPTTGRRPPRAPQFRVHNPDPGSSEGGSQRRWCSQDPG